MANIPDDTTSHEPVKGRGDIIVPSVGHYEDLIGFQRGTIRDQAKVISELTETIRHLQRAFTQSDGVVDAQIQDGRSF
ncbi:MAG: hypothetical protein ACTHZD_16110 [Micrococcaceae bacterium]